MSRHDTYVGLIRSTVLVCSIGFGGSSLALAEEPTSPPAPSDESVQERDVPRQPGIGSASEVTGDAPGKETGGSEAVPPVVEGQPASPAEAGDIQERGVLRGVLPGLVAPGATLQITAPTPSLTAIRNAIRITSKSISVNLRLPANLPVTVPVEVSVGYYSPAQTQRKTKTYNPASGLTLLYREAEGDGKPRAMRLDIAVRELVPNGQSFSFSKQFTITPLYDVFVTDLIFFMASPCDRIGKSDYTFSWYSPDGQRHEQKFKLGFDKRKRGITQFSWARKEIRTQANLREPVVQFVERDLLPSLYDSPFVSSGAALVPGPTTKYHFFLKKETTGPPGQPRYSGGGCEAEITYTIIRALMPFDQF